jgi:DnaJ-class molecular chaperone
MENGNAKIEKPCGYCSGTGNALEGFFSDRGVCPICNGCGKVNVPADAVLHDTCKGQGKIRMRGPMGKLNFECSDCRGTGWISPT